MSSLWCCRATAVAHAEWMAVIQFSSSVWLQVCDGMDSERSKVKQHNPALAFAIIKKEKRKTSLFLSVLMK